MPKPTNARAYIFENDVIYDFMWGDVGDDTSVYFGLTGKGNQFIEQVVLEKNERKDRFSNTNFHSFNGSHKISFHKSGRYTLSNEYENEKVKNRFVVKGTPLPDISEPTRMMDIIIPINLLRPTKKSIADSNIKLGGILNNSTHICCTVYCMAESKQPSFGENCASIIKGASWESKDGFISEGKAWIFVLHDSVDSSMKKGHYLIYIHGEVL